VSPEHSEIEISFNCNFLGIQRAWVGHCGSKFIVNQI